ncbi:MAG: DUF11 domain-containing protein [Anaerolineae bacterium]
MGREGDDIGANLNQGSAYIFIRLPPDLALTKTVNPAGPVSPGQAITYTVAFSNAGPGWATNVTLADNVPANLANVSYSSSGAAITQTNSGAITYTWNAQDLAPGQGGIVTITGQVTATSIAAGRFTNTATITSPEAEPNLANNSAAVGLDIPLARPTYPRWPHLRPAPTPLRRGKLSLLTAAPLLTPTRMTRLSTINGILMGMAAWMPPASALPPYTLTPPLAYVKPGWP